MFQASTVSPVSIDFQGYSTAGSWKFEKEIRLNQDLMATWNEGFLETIIF